MCFLSNLTKGNFMQIEKGELFVVTRGYQCGRISSDPIFAAAFGIPVQPELEQPQYDRSYEGRVFRAIEVCGPVIAAEIVFGDVYSSKIRSLNTNEIEIWPVTQAYLDALQTK
jgi:hypothetical protein